MTKRKIRVKGQAGYKRGPIFPPNVVDAAEKDAARQKWAREHSEQEKRAARRAFLESLGSTRNVEAYFRENPSADNPLEDLFRADYDARSQRTPADVVDHFTPPYPSPVEPVRSLFSIEGSDRQLIYNGDNVWYREPATRAKAAMSYICAVSAIVVDRAGNIFLTLADERGHHQRFPFRYENVYNPNIWKGGSR